MSPDPTASSLMAKLIAENPELLKRGGVFRRSGVHESADWLRVISLPRRDLDLDAVPDLTPLFATPTGSMRLWPVQSAALFEAEAAGGLFLSAPVGTGKALISALLPYALQSKRTALLVPAQLKRRTVTSTFPALSQHFVLPLDRIEVVSYTELERSATGDVLERLQPDFIVADEAHMLKNRQAARTIRFEAYLKAHPECRLAVMTGTFSDGSLLDWAHLMRYALGPKAPIPITYMALSEWAEALDAGDDPRPPGALERLCEREDHVHRDVNHRFACRLVTARGVLAIQEGFDRTPLAIRSVDYVAPPAIVAALDRLRKSWEVGNPETPEAPTEEITDDLSFSRYARQLALGFYLRWVWPNGRDTEWLEARAAWGAVVRHCIRYHKARGWISPMLVENAAARGELDADAMRVWAEWSAVSERKPPPTEAVWLTKAVIEHAADRASATNAVVWYDNVAVGEALADRLACGLPRSVAALKFDGRAVPLSLGVFKQGVDGLQALHTHAIYLHVPNAKFMEQSLGRLHREGQTRACSAELYLHTPELVAKFEATRKRAEHAEAQGWGKQKLNRYWVE